MNRFHLRIFLLFLLLCSYGIIAQTAQRVEYRAVKYKSNVDAPLTNDELTKIKEVYKQSTEDVILNDKAHLKRIKHLLRNRIKILKLGIKDQHRIHTLLSEVELFNHFNPNLTRDLVFDKYGFNPLKYNLNLYPSENILYRIDGTNYYIRIMSQFQ